MVDESLLPEDGWGIELVPTVDIDRAQWDRFLKSEQEPCHPGHHDGQGVEPFVAVGWTFDEVGVAARPVLDVSIRHPKPMLGVYRQEVLLEPVMQFLARRTVDVHGGVRNLFEVIGEASESRTVVAVGHLVYAGESYGALVYDLGADRSTAALIDRETNTVMARGTLNEVLDQGIRMHAA